VTQDYGVTSGQVIAGKYQLVEPIGRGGMGSVWRATATELVADVDSGSPPPGDGTLHDIALKIILPKRLDTTPQKRDTAIGRFLREARALTKLKSPHVVLIYDHGRDGQDIVFIAMELLRGESLSARLKRLKKLDASETMRVLTHVGRAVSLAHRHGIVHRDLKPANIFLCKTRGTSEMVAKVLDFGLVKSIDVPLATVDVHTRTGALLGTPYYMSPEQARGSSEVDHRADLWSLGVIAFECLCGMKPFRGRALARVFAQISAGEAPVPSHVADVPAGFDEWFARAVRVDPAERFPSADAMFDELREVLVDAATNVKAARLRRLEGETGFTLDLSADEVRTARIDRKTEASKFIGRDDVLAAIERAIDAGTRIVTLIGPAGIGKTRLAREAMRRSQERRRTSTWACWLDEANGEPWLWLEIAAGLDMDGVGEPAPDGIARALRSMGRAVVLLDGIGDVTAPLTLALPSWLAAAPEIVFLLTGPKPLRMSQEAVIEVPPFPPPIARVEGLRDLMAHPAAALFMVRAVPRDRKLLAADARAGELARLCTRMGGVPLAIDLAAAFVDTVPIEDISHGLSTELHRPGGTTIIDPDTTLHGTLSWAFKQLSPAEQSALAQLSVFRDGFTLDAVEAVVDGSWRLVKRPYEIVLELTRRGLLSHEEPIVGEDRYRMHAAVARFAAEKLAELASGRESLAHQLSARHAAHFATMGGDDALEAIERRGGIVRRARLEIEINNLRTALGWALSQADAALVAPLGRAVCAVLAIERMWSAAAASAMTVLSCAGLSVRQQLSMRLCQGRCLRVARRPELAMSALDHARQIAAELADARSEASAMRELGAVALARGNPGDAHRWLTAALQLTTDQASPRADVLAALGCYGLELGQAREAGAAFEQAVTLYRETGDRQLEAEALAAWAELCAEHDANDRATELFKLADDLHDELGNRVQRTAVLAWIGELEARTGSSHAARTLERAAARARELGAVDLEALHLSLWALYLLERGERDRARRAVKRAEELADRSGDAHKMAAVHCCRAWLDFGAGRKAEAEVELHRAEADARTAKLRPGSRVARAIARLRNALRGMA
jgi:serine/threonine-protein kinase